MVHLLMADGDESARGMVRAATQKKEYSLDEAHDGISAIKLFRRKQYDAVILEVHLRELSGLHVCRQIRKSSDVPIVFLSTKSREYDRLAGYAAGADSYLTKPFFPSELLAQIDALLTRSGTKKERSFLFCGGISMNLRTHEVFIDEKEIALSPREYSLLSYLLQYPNIVLSRERILNEVWGADFQGTDRTVDTHIKTLREQIKPYGKSILTVWGVGYKLSTD